MTSERSRVNNGKLGKNRYFKSKGLQMYFARNEYAKIQ